MKRWLVLLFLTGCAVGPNYHPPEIAIADTWTAADTPLTGEMPQRWWELFQDSQLCRYIELASAQNFDIQSAEANILKARALRQIAASKLFPQVGADFNGTKTYFSKNGPVFEIGQAAGNPADTSSTTTGLPFSLQIPQIQNLFNALFDASWELDLFGKTRRMVEAADAAYESAIERKNDILVSTLAEVARNYIELRSWQKRAELLQNNIELSEMQTAIIEANLKAGYANQIDLETSQAALSSTLAALPDAYSEIYRAIYSLSILLGHPPETLVDELIAHTALPEPPLQIAIGLRSDILRRRPDVRFAERRLAEATAGIGVAIASFFPTTTLLSNGGFQSLALPQLFEWGSKTWAYGADVNMPLFQGGRLIGNLHLARAEQATAAASYQQTVLQALQDAETNLKKYQNLALSTEEYKENVLHNSFVVTITKERFQKGLINRLDLIKNEQKLVSAKLTELDSRSAELLALVSLYKSLGGGWEAIENTPPTPAPSASSP